MEIDHLSSTEELDSIIRSGNKTGNFKFADVLFCYVEGKLHREDGGPAIMSDDYISYYINDKLHREDGPARVWLKDNIKEYYLDNVFYWKDDFIKNRKIKIAKLYNIIESNPFISSLFYKKDIESKLVLQDFLLENYSDNIDNIKKDLKIFKFLKTIKQ